MAQVVREIMNPELFSVTRDEQAADVLEGLLTLGITAVPVLDEGRRPIGVTSLRDLVRKNPERVVSSPALCVPMNARVEDAARMMAECGRHHLVVVGSDGRAVGMISSMDLLRALLGWPPKAPATFPHFDAVLGVTWTDVNVFDEAHIAAAPPGPGVLVLSTGGRGRSEVDVFVEPAEQLRARLGELQTSNLVPVTAGESLRFRCSEIAEVAVRDRVAGTLRWWLDHASVGVGQRS